MATDLHTSKFPPPVSTRSDWPFVADVQTFPDRRPDGSPWPRITVVTPSRNQADYLEETLRSVLSQGYPNLEYIVMDGGSTDGSVELIRRYSPWIAHWRSGPDGGQTQAIQAALQLATGDLFNWINSDDVLAKNALAHLGQALTDDVDMVAGKCVHFSGDRVLQTAQVADLDALGLIHKRKGCNFRQPAMWIRPRNALAVGGLDPTFQFAFDMDLAIRYLSRFPAVTYVPHELARFREHPESKTISQADRFTTELAAIMDKLQGELTDTNERHGCAVMADRYRWQSVLESVGLDFRQSGFSRAGRICREALRVPRDRLLDRATWKTVRRCLVGKYRTEAAYRRALAH